ncbi:cytochrome P450 [Rhodococcus sp. PAMC28707]|uniref:cytochrome P450 n=1 Tax=unclassified Rhodococcus (in: high G+C Gram-positive bacteria) TaxID=192944 RepID=UPI00109DDE6D|nr:MULTISPECIES: cytochrome P450 [unclassified Rhodococcus (in: high G+C Gram-positive bacteria)]QCB49916.1 cytochrome P450 [Rhodococcus sp. PAMC28705]QCB58391.1 cytochrome P450 [Rhodococcus sp. PAMC28707]
MNLPKGIDVTDPALYNNGIPHELFAELRKNHPVWWNEQPSGIGGFEDEGYWVVSTHALVQEVSRDSDLYSSWENTAIARYSDHVPRAAIDANRGIMLNMDAPEHTALRKIISRGFTPRAIAKLRDALSARANKIVADALTDGTGEFVADIAAELPLQAITELIGIPQEQRHKVFEWSNIMTGRDDPDIIGDPVAAIGQVMQYSMGLAADRRECPAEDIATALVRAQDEDGALTDLEFGYFVVLLMVAGSETTRNAITHGMMAFQDNPEQWETFRRERPKTAIDEIIRWSSPVFSFQRTATRDTELGGQSIGKGDRLLMLYASANYDETVFEDPHTFDIGRDPNPHLGFGGTGAHYCIGANLARMEIELIYDAIAEQMPDISVIGPPSRLNSSFINSVKSLPVSYGTCPVQPR